MRVSQGFANTFFRSFTFVLQDSQGFADTSLARFRDSQFHKNLQISLSFRKLRKFFAMGSLLSFADDMIVKLQKTVMMDSMRQFSDVGLRVRPSGVQVRR